MTKRGAVVVGGASGIGRAVAHALAADGFRVTVADRNTDGAHAVAAELGAPHTAATVESPTKTPYSGCSRNPARSTPSSTPPASAGSG